MTTTTTAIDALRAARAEAERTKAAAENRIAGIDIALETLGGGNIADPMTSSPAPAAANPSARQLDLVRDEPASRTNRSHPTPNLVTLGIPKAKYRQMVLARRTGLLDILADGQPRKLVDCYQELRRKLGAELPATIQGLEGDVQFFLRTGQVQRCGMGLYRAKLNDQPASVEATG